MKAKDFPERNLEIAKDQPQYATLPAHHDPKEGTITVCFELSEDEINRMVATNELWIQVLTFNRPLQPIRCSTLKEELISD